MTPSFLLSSLSSEPSEQPHPHPQRLLDTKELAIHHQYQNQPGYLVLFLILLLLGSPGFLLLAFLCVAVNLCPHLARLL